MGFRLLEKSDNFLVGGEDSLNTQDQLYFHFQI